MMDKIDYHKILRLSKTCEDKKEIVEKYLDAIKLHPSSRKRALLCRAVLVLYIPYLNFVLKRRGETGLSEERSEELIKRGTQQLEAKLRSRRERSVSTTTTTTASYESDTSSSRSSSSSSSNSSSSSARSSSSSSLKGENLVMTPDKVKSWLDADTNSEPVVKRSRSDDHCDDRSSSPYRSKSKGMPRHDHRLKSHRKGKAADIDTQNDYRCM